jgi:hypothetical protein
VLEIASGPSERQLDTVALRQGLAPGAGEPGTDIPADSRFREFHRSALNNQDGILFEAALDVPGDDRSRSALFSTASGELSLVAVSSGPAADAGESGWFRNLALNESGTPAFESWVSAGPNHYVGDSIAAATGETAPGTGGARFANLHDAALDGNGQLFFPGHLEIGSADPAVTRYNDTGLWGSIGGLIAREGEPSPLPGIDYSHLNSRVVSSAAGKIAFAANLSNAPNAAVFAGEPGALVAIAQIGDPAPGTASSFAGFASESISTEGALVIRAQLALGDDISSSNNGGLWTDRSGDLALVAREGDVAPCLPAGSSARFERFTKTSIGGDGTIFFYAYLAGDGVDSSNDGSLWKVDPSGAIHLLAREGDAANNTAEKLGTLVSFANNDRGDIAYLARFASGGDGADALAHTGVWYQGEGDPAARLVLRRGDRFGLDSGEMRSVAAIKLEAQTNPYGGSGGYGRLLDDSGRLLLHLLLSHNVSGVFLLDPSSQPEGLLAAPLRARSEVTPKADQKTRSSAADRPLAASGKQRPTDRGQLREGSKSSPHSKSTTTGSETRRPDHGIPRAIPVVKRALPVKDTSAARAPRIVDTPDRDRLRENSKTSPAKKSGKAEPETRQTPNIPRAIPVDKQAQPVKGKAHLAPA